ncbi:MAG: hypothetical protein ACOYNY_02715 [Caldilineaceae bacterium]|jgi:hypothetical protein
MTTVHVVSEVTLNVDQMLEGVAQLDLAELERFAFRVSGLVARRKAPSLPKREAELLQQINQGLPAPQWQRYQTLNAKLLAEHITPDEHQELGALIDQIEQLEGERLAHLIELAQLRNVPLATLMAQLGIGQSGNG